MTGKILVIFMVIIQVFCSFVTAKFHISLKTKFNGVLNLSMALTQEQGFTVKEKQAVLDVHNALRNYVARGKEMNADGGPAPSASNMLAMEWDDRLAKYSQNWANTCPDDHSRVKVNEGGYAKGAVAENICGDYAAIERDMYGEVKYFNYASQTCRAGHQCGHYVAMASWSYFRLGCGWKACKKPGNVKLVMVCLFAPMSTGGQEVSGTRHRHQYEYYKGQPCSECPQGWNYCLGGGLCATKKQCESDSSNKCVCLNKQSVCESNGGTFDADNCECKCPSNKFGLNCANPCANTKGELFCGPSCQNSIIELFLCPKACSGCGQATSPVYKHFMKNHPTVNSDNLKVTINAPNPKVPNPPDMSKLPSYGKCVNKESDFVCENLRVRGYCHDIVWAIRWQYFCQLSCDSCGSTAWLSFVKKKGLSEGDTVEGSEENVVDTGWKEVGGETKENTIIDGDGHKTSELYHPNNKTKVTIKDGQSKGNHQESLLVNYALLIISLTNSYYFLMYFS